MIKHSNFIALSLSLLCSISGFSQTNIYELNNNVGISTATPIYKLDIVGGEMMFGANSDFGLTRTNAIDKAIRLYVPHFYNAEKPATLITGGAVENSSFVSIGGGTVMANAVTQIQFNTAENNTTIGGTIRMLINSVGNIGMGTTTPQHKLDVIGKGYFSSSVGIGTAQLGDPNYKLFVETGIRTRKIKVDQANWPDYVFRKDYNLPSLSEVEKFINKFEHLPGVESAETVAKDGVDLGSNQAMLLRKIEELTLYIIDQNKRLIELEKKNRAGN